MTVTSHFRLLFPLSLSVLALSACENSVYKDWKQGVTGERSAQTVEGTRHAPVLNPAGSPSAIPAGMSQPLPPPAAPQSSNPANNPYDSYDDKGNPVAPKTTAGQPAGNDVRKPIPGNMPNEELAPLAPLPTPQSMIEPVPQKTTTSEESSWFSRSWDKMKAPFTKSEIPAEDKAAAAAPYPELSQVPKPPAQFAEVKTGKQQQMEELQSDHMQAQLEKQNLAIEPSQIDAEAPVASVSSVPPVNIQPTSATLAKPVLLGHVSDSHTPIVSAPTPIPAPAPVPVAAATPAPEMKPLLEEPAKATAPVTVQAAISPAADATAEQTLPAASDNALPSPAILQEVKVLPPSRYSARMRAEQQ